jgi:hypothetical protein
MNNKMINAIFKASVFIDNIFIYFFVNPKYIANNPI